MKMLAAKKLMAFNINFCASYQHQIFLIVAVRITKKRVTSGRAHFRGLALSQQSSTETSQRWRDVGDTVPDLTDRGFEPQVSRINSNVITTGLTAWCINIFFRDCI